MFFNTGHLLDAASLGLVLDPASSVFIDLPFGKTSSQFGICILTCSCRLVKGFGSLLFPLLQAQLLKPGELLFQFLLICLLGG
jgi:hypothetical protein